MDTVIFENGVIHQGGEDASVEALLVEDGSITFAGSSADCRRGANGAHRRVDLAGAHVVPGFIDSHVHIAQAAMQALELDVSSARSCEAALLLVEGALRGSGAALFNGLTSSGWLIGGGWAPHLWSDPRTADRVALDSVSAETPIALHSANLHSYWLNTPALARLGIDRHTPDPLDGGIERWSDREPTGIVSESAAFGVQRFLENKHRGELDDQMLRMMERFLAVGVTRIHDLDGPTALQCFTTLASERRLPVRVHKLTPVWDLDVAIENGVTSGCGDNWLDYGGVKIFADGSLSSHTCSLRADFLDQPGNTGTIVTAPDELGRIIEKCERHGLAVAVHAIGDAAVTLTLDALTTRPGRTARSGVPHRIEHFQHATAADVQRAANAGVIACMQPASCATDMELVDRMLGDRDLVSYGWHSLLTAGATVAFSSDAPVEDINPFVGIHAATTRQRRDGAPAGGWQPQERLSRARALECYTKGSAIAAGRSDREGSLAVGQLADFAVVDRDPLTVDDQALLETSVTMTVVGGQIRFSQ